MYRKKERNTQMLFRELMPFGGKLNENNRWLRLRDLIPWEELEEEYGRYFSERGRPALDAQLVIGVICIKHIEKLSDEAVVERLLENPYMQAFCGLENFTSEGLLDGSSLSRLRKRLGRAYFRKLEKYVFRVLRERKLIKANGTMVDATVFPGNIRYPTDVSLLNEVRQWLVEKIVRIGKKTGIRKRTYRRKARKEYLSFSSRRKKTRKAVKVAKKAMLQYVRRNLKQFEELASELKKRGLKLASDVRKRFETARKIYEQQALMYREKVHRVRDRIVSFHQPEIRPIVRGKAGKEVEFGPKGAVSLVDGYMFLDKLSYDNFNESQTLPGAVEQYEERFGRMPEELIGDGIYGNRENRKYLKEKGIRTALKPLGRRAQSREAEQHRNWVRRKQKQRNRIEGMIGHGKEHFGLDRIRYRIDEGAEIWVRMGLLGMNLDTALKRI